MSVTNSSATSRKAKGKAKIVVDDWPAVIEQVKREYYQLNRVGVFKTTIRTMHYR
jgi:hypothetical protein